MSKRNGLGVVVIVAALCGACGSTASDASGTVEIFSWWVAPGEREALEALIATHTETHPDTTVVNAAATDATTARDRLATRLADGNPPDVFQSTQGTDLIRHVLVNGTGDSERVIERLDELRDQEGWDDVFPPEVLDAVSHDGHLYGVPLNVHRINALFYNAHVLEEHGLTPPTTVDELVASCEALASASPPVPCLAISARAGWTLALLLFEAILPGQAGADFYESYLAGHEAADDPRVLAAIDTFLELYAYAHPSARSMTWDQSIERLSRGEAAFSVMGDWAKGYLVGRGAEPEVDFGQVPFPSVEPTFVYTADAFALARGAPNRAAALALLRTAGSARAQIAFNVVKGSIPARLDASTDSFDALGRATAEDFATARVTPSVQASVSPRFTDPIHEAMIDLVDRGEPMVLVSTLRAYYDILQN